MSGLAPRPGLLDIAPYKGGESTLAGRAKAIKLSSNEGALGPSPRALAAFRKATAHLHRYPDGSAAQLREAIAKLHGIDKERIVCGAGSDDLIHLLCLAYAGPGDQVLYTRHGFLLYPIAARSVGAEPVVAPETDLRADVSRLLERVTERTRVVFIANPNNPTGTYLSRGEVRRLRDGLPARVLLVLDAAYAEYVDRNDYSAGVDMVDERDNVVMTRTFSKIYGLGGARLGWAYCPAAVADVLNRIRNPFNAAAPALAAGIAAVEDVGHTERVRRHTLEWKAWTEEKLKAHGFDVRPSVCNFLLVRLPDGDGRNADAADAFLKSRGIIVRRVAAYGLPDHLRITVGRASEMRALVKALGDFAKAGRR